MAEDWDIKPGTFETYQKEFTRCQHEGCHCRNAGDPGHGPYFYAYFRDSKGQRKKKYIGKNLRAFLLRQLRKMIEEGEDPARLLKALERFED